MTTEATPREGAGSPPEIVEVRRAQRPELK